MVRRARSGHATTRSADEPAIASDRVPNTDCDFARLPVYVVDEDIYRVRPTLVIGTVDKFAALPWRPEVGNLFNLDEPPDRRRT